MNIYRIWQTENICYDTFDSAVVIAESEDAARKIHPFSSIDDYQDSDEENWDLNGSWVPHPNMVSVMLIGVAKEGSERGVVCASFNAG